MDGRLAILVEFVLAPEGRERFHELVRANAAASLQEAGCRQFDVLLPADAADRVVLYEIYDDAQAFDAHLATDHYREFARASEAVVRDKRVTRLGFVGNLPP